MKAVGEWLVRSPASAERISGCLSKILEIIGGKEKIHSLLNGKSIRAAVRSY
jgi:hypothetical protein